MFHMFPDLTPGGFYGVDVFFVISGYLITGIIIREDIQQGFSFRKFYARRVRRLFPALDVVLAAVLLSGSLVLFPADLKELGLDTMGSVFFVPKKLVKAIAELHPTIVVLFAAWFDYGGHWEESGVFADSLSKTLKTLRDDKIRGIVVVGPSPTWAPSLPILVYNYWKRNGTLPDRLQPNPHPYQLADCTIGRIARDNGAQFISLHDNLCDQRGCLTHAAAGRAELMTWDYRHLTLAGAKFVAGLIGDRSPRPDDATAIAAARCDGADRSGP